MKLAFLSFIENKDVIGLYVGSAQRQSDLAVLNDQLNKLVINKTRDFETAHREHVLRLAAVLFASGGSISVQKEVIELIYGDDGANMFVDFVTNDQDGSVTLVLNEYERESVNGDEEGDCDGCDCGDEECEA